MRFSEARIRSIFAPGGELSLGIADFEARPEQARFAEEVLETLTGGGCLVIEAATGVGKSLGYLVPSLASSMERERPVVVSTNTKNLQEQLIEKDIPLLEEIFGGGFSAVALKGRGNYICLRKWKELVESERGGGKGEGEANARAGSFIRTVTASLQLFPAGDVGEVAGSAEPSLWERVSSDSSACLSSLCRHASACYWRKAKRRASQANIVIVNHSLLFSDVGCGRSILPEYDTLILDEAHNVERVATEHFGVEVSSSRVGREIERLTSARGALGFIRKRLGRRLPKLRRLTISVKTQEIERGLEAVSRVRERAFGRLSEFLQPFGSAPTVRFGNERLSLPAEFEEMSFACSKVEELLLALAESIKESAELVSDIDEVLAEIAGVSERWKSLATDLMFLWEASSPEFVYWVQQRFGEDIALKACPVWVRRGMREHVLSGLRSVVLTSATMAVAGRLDHFVFRMGLESPYEPRCTVIDSPFDYARQVIAAVPQDFPDPRQSGFVSCVGEFLSSLLEASPRKTLVLFTAYDMLREVHGIVQGALAERGITVLGQGLDGARSELMETFRGCSKALLLGTSSFWEGIDLPGEALETVVVVRLPFPVPDDPVVQARSEALLEDGKEPFTEYLLPEAVIRLRQGFGRLIRRRTDRGAIIIVDPRITRANYGSVFAKSLPAVLEPCRTGELPSRISGWFREFEERSGGSAVSSAFPAPEKASSASDRRSSARRGKLTSAKKRG